MDDPPTPQPEGSSTGGPQDTNDGVPSPIIWDVATIPDAPNDEAGCRAVDFVFVIDNSGSMASHQANLATNFPTFIDGIQSTLSDVSSYQVGVISTDAYSYNAPGCDVLGGLVVQTGGTQSSQGICGPYAEGNNYMTQEDDLGQAFTCAAKVGTSGSATERPMDALRVVTNRELSAPDACNEGFIRDDALLVIVLITDEADGPGDPELGSGVVGPEVWFDNVVAVKDGIAQNVVVVSLLNYEGGPCEPGGPIDDGENIVTFTEMFGENGFVGGICALNYGPTFSAAIGVIENACANFTPQN